MKNLEIKEELAMYGGARLELEELLMVLIGINKKKMKELIAKYGTLKSLLKDSNNIRGISVTQKAKLSAFKELNNQMNICQEKVKISSPDIIFDLYKNEFSMLDVEHFDIILLDTKNQILGKTNISKGTLNASIVHPRDVMREALRMNVNALILCHNHPSGDPHPSDEDINITNRLVDAGHLMGIKVLDHIIFGDNRYISFKEKNLM